MKRVYGTDLFRSREVQLRCAIAVRLNRLRLAYHAHVKSNTTLARQGLEQKNKFFYEPPLDSKMQPPFC